MNGLHSTFGLDGYVSTECFTLKILLHISLSENVIVAMSPVVVLVLVQTSNHQFSC
jgi:hypothetical protein